MKTHTLGNGLEVSALGLGCMSMTSAYGPAADKPSMIKLIRSAHEQGITLFDTAEAYGPFANEELLGKALQPIREQVVIASKFGFDIDLVTGARAGGTNSRPEHIRAVAERKQATPAQVALTWLLAQKPWIVPIPGTTKQHRLEENLGAVELELTGEDLRVINEQMAQIQVHGERLPESALKMTGL